MTRVIVCGGRTYADKVHIFAALDAVHACRQITTLVHGGARGTDTLPELWAKTCGVPVKVYLADWKRHGLSAGPLRNEEMAAAGADLCVAFPGDTVTADMCQRAQAAGIRVLRA